jgi:conserved oligomeric Golgi complex subunit 8
VKTIEKSWHVMITQLLLELKCDLTLPKCLQIVGFLRRMQAFSTPELKLKFLQTRDSWFKEILAGIPKTDGELFIGFLQSILIDFIDFQPTNI